MQLALNAAVVVTARDSFRNLADLANPAENLVGVAMAASEGAVTARQIESRPIMRAGEVLETVPGVIISQHSGEGKANQYYLRGFNLDHGTDFATTVAGLPVNLAYARARTGIFGSELPDPRARERRPVQERALLRAGRRLFRGRVRQCELPQRSSPARSQASASVRTDGRACSPASHRGSAPGISSRHSNSIGMTVPGRGRTTTERSTASFGTAAAPRRMRFR